MHPLAVALPAVLALVNPPWDAVDAAPGQVAPGNPLLPIPSLLSEGLTGWGDRGAPVFSGLPSSIDAGVPRWDAADGVLTSEVDAADDADDAPPRVPLAGCELGLDGQTPEAWSRELWIGAPWPEIVAGGHTGKDGQWVDYLQIPRRPGRPESYDAYRYPLLEAPVVSGYDLDREDDEQRRGSMNAVGHGGVDLVDHMGAPISMIRLEHQVGSAEVVYVGPLYGETVVTRHALREGGVTRDYVLIFGHLDRPGDDVRRGQRLREGAIVGYVGNSDSPNLVHLHLEARRVRDHVDAWKLAGGLVLLRESTVVTDPRNVLPLKTPPRKHARCAPTLVRPARRYWLGDSMSLALDL